MKSKIATTLTSRDRKVIAQYLRQMAGDTNALLHLADATLAGDIAAILRARAASLEANSASVSAPVMAAPGLAIYGQS